MGRMSARSDGSADAYHTPLATTTTPPRPIVSGAPTRSATTPASRLPTPTAPISAPSVLGPPCRRSAAIAGINTVYGMPIVLVIATSRRDVRIGIDAITYDQPWRNSSMGCVSDFFVADRGVVIASSEA